MASTKALVKPELLAWARGRASVSLEDAAAAAHADVADLEDWETPGGDAPTLSQLRLLAAKYHFPLAVFFLPEPPLDFSPLRDFRRIDGAPANKFSANLAFHIRQAYERREVALELHDDIREAPRPFPIKAKLTDNPETVANAIRTFLEIDDDVQLKAAKDKKAFDFWRRRLEEHDLMVFVISGPHYSVELSEMRGFAIAKTELPVIVVNGRDYSQGGKCYTLLHELAHIVLGESAISNGTGEEFGSSAEELRVERFCDAVAAATLMPRNLVLSFPAAKAAGERKWSDDELRLIANAIGVSREALLIRFITLGRASWSFYHSQRQRFKDEYLKAAEEKANAPKKDVKIKRSIMLMSWNGRGYTRLVLRSYYDQRITLNDVSSYLGAKVKHIPALERAAFMSAD
jgi:Zn-dependent peptidase ImmA (M78 family)